MWLVLRKTKPQNNTLKLFYTEAQPFRVQLKDIIKFGRVNFKISALSSDKLRPEIQGKTQTQRNANNNYTLADNQNLQTQFNNEKN
jgi:hypothetical protein